MKSPNSIALENIITSLLREVSESKNKLVQQEQQSQDQVKELMLNIIDIVDSFERVEEGLIERELNQSADGAKVMQRYKNIHKKLLQMLAINGIEPVIFPDNLLIVGYTKVVNTVPDSNRNNDEIDTIIRNGYVYGNEIIREAEVIIVKN